MQKYYVLGFPENQEFTDDVNCYWIADGMMLAVPCELYDSKKSYYGKNLCTKTRKFMDR